MKRTMFREYDIRGRVDDDEMCDENIDLIAKAFATYLLKRDIHDVIVGYDSRSYSKGFGYVAARALKNSGLNVHFIGLSMTPTVYWAQYFLKIKGAIMITASHNPNGWAGLKLADGLSKTLIADDIKELLSYIDDKDFSSGEGVIKMIDLKDDYISDLSSKVSLKKPLKVVVDTGNGTAGVFTPEILRRAGCEVIELFCDLDSSFPNHEPNPSLKEARIALSKTVRDNSADIGIGIDGDGDRLGVVDERGVDVWTDKVIVLLARQLLKEKPGSKIVFDVKCTQALPEDIIAHGGVPIMWKTGHSWIKKKMHEEKAALAGERSGHIFFSHGYYGFDDGSFAALKLVEFLSCSNNVLSEIVASTPQYITSPEIQASCPDEVKYSVVDKLTDEFKKEYDDVITINGARVNFGDGWGLVRASSNLPKLVLIFEAKTADRMNQIKEIFREKLSKYPEISTKWDNE